MFKSKICAECGERKPRSEFFRRSASKDGLQRMCKPCSIQKRKQWANTQGRGMDAFYKQEHYKREAPLLKAKVHEVLGRECERCGEDDIRVLDIDHKNGRNGEKRKHGLSYLRYVISHPGEFRMLCKNCNWIAYLERGEPSGRPRQS